MSPGSWLRAFRRAGTTETEGPLTPEQLAPKIGVSGATVRRWESGSSIPTTQDIRNLAAYYRLSSTQLGFLQQAFGPYEPGPPARPQALQQALRAVCEPRFAQPFPVVLLDGLFFARAWNRRVEDLWPGISKAFAWGIHPIQLLIRLQQRGTVSLSDTAMHDAIRYFWLSTAGLSNTSAYRRLILSLARHNAFRHGWDQLLREDGDSPLVVDISPSWKQADGAIFRPELRAMSGEPHYLVFELRPENDVARRVPRRSRVRRPSIMFHSTLHWTLDQ